MNYPCPLCTTDTGLCICARDCGYPSCDGDPSVSYSTDAAARARSHYARTGEVSSHGDYGYHVGCRCRICTVASSEAQRKWRAAHPPRIRERVDARTGATCSECHRMIKITAKGVFVKHSTRDGRGGCRGQGKRPDDTEGHKHD